MPALDLSDYVPTLDRILTHWQETEETTGETLTLPDGTTRAMLEKLRPQLLEGQNGLIAAVNDRQGAASLRDTTRKSAHNVAKRFNTHTRNVLPGTPFVRELPVLPALSADPQKQLQAFRDILDIWRRIDDAPGESIPPSCKRPLQVRVLENKVENVVTLSLYEARTDAFAEAVRRWDVAMQQETGALTARNRIQDRVEAAVAAYRKLVRGLFPEGGPILATLP